MTEDEILTRVTLEAVLATLMPADRVLLSLVYQLDRPADYAGVWPPTYVDVGAYVGLRFEGRVLSESAIRYRRDVIIALLRRERGPLRRLDAEMPQKSLETASKSSRKRRKT